MKNPNAKLEQLRRTSLVEIEHLTKDPHPDPPLRALPEHSVLEDKDVTTSRPPQSGGASSQGPNTASGFVGAQESKSGHVDNSSADQSVPGIAAVDFAQGTGAREGSKSSGGNSSEGLFFTSQGLSHASSSTSQQQSSSSYSSSTSHQQTSSSDSSTQQSSSSTGQRIQSGKMTFTLPDFGKDNGPESAAAQEDVLSPTQPQDE